MYESLRDFADSWALVGLVVVFAAIVLYVFRRGDRARKSYDEASKIPFRDEDDKLDS